VRRQPSCCRLAEEKKDWKKGLSGIPVSHFGGGGKREKDVSWINGMDASSGKEGEGKEKR